VAALPPGRGGIDLGQQPQGSDPADLARFMSIVVSGGLAACAMLSQLSYPTIAMSSGT
jgi:hypothetical protein